MLVVSDPTAHHTDPQILRQFRTPRVVAVRETSHRGPTNLCSRDRSCRYSKRMQRVNRLDYQHLPSRRQLLPEQ